MPAHTELHTERLWLRPFRASDAPAVLAYRDDPLFARFLPRVQQPFTERDAEAFVALALDEPWESAATFAVIFADRLIGSVNLQVEAELRLGMLGYGLGRAWWGQGLGTEAARAVVEWGAAAYGVTRICATTDGRNVRSRRVLEKLGMRYDSVRARDHVGRDGEWVDEVVYVLDLAP